MKHLPVYLVLLLLGSCRTQNLFERSAALRESETALIDSTFIFDSAYQYTIRKDDKINLSIWGQDELSVGSVYGIYNSNEAYGKWLLVDANGNIEVPKIGTLCVLSQTIPQVKDTLKHLLSRWIINPIVDVKVVNKEITIVGEVRNPASIHIDQDRITLIDLLAKTEGHEFYANLKKVKVIRQNGTVVKTAQVDLTRADHYTARNIQLHPGDVVVVSAKRNKEFDKRISTIIPLTTAITSLAILMGLFL